MKNKVPTSQILQVSLNLFSLKGYSETKMVDIASHVGMSVGALYLRFKSKETLCLELIKDQTQDFVQQTKRLPDNDPLSALRRYITLNLDYTFQKKQLLSLFYREHKLPLMKPLRRNFFRTQHRIIHDILRKGIETGIFRPINAEETASMIFASIRGAILLKLIFGVGDSRKMSNSLFTLITDGLRKDEQ